MLKITIILASVHKTLMDFPGERYFQTSFYGRIAIIGGREVIVLSTVTQMIHLITFVVSDWTWSVLVNCLLVSPKLSGFLDVGTKDAMVSSCSSSL